MSDSEQILTDIPIELICLSLTPPLLKHCRMRFLEPGICEVILDEPVEGLAPGLPIVLDAGQGEKLRLKGTVATAEACCVRVATERIVDEDKRAFLRMCAALRVHYRVVDTQDEAKVTTAWLNGEEIPGDAADWHAPDPFMDFSSTGLRFEDRLTCQEGDALLVELQIRSGESPWRATATVVRIDQLDQEDQRTLDEEQSRLAPSHKIAVEFLQIPTEAAEALAEYTVKIQDALLQT